MPDVEDFIDIDQDRLDQEWVRQPRLALEVGMKEADASKEVDEAKASLELIESEELLNIMLHPDAYGLEKTTELVVKAKVITLANVIAAKKVLMEAKHRQKIYGARTNAVEHRKRTLEKLVDLELMHWRSEPKPSDTTAAREFAANATKMAARQPMKKKAKLNGKPFKTKVKMKAKRS